MDDSEAEAVLLALGPCLDWEPVAHPGINPNIPDGSERAFTAEGIYSVVRKTVWQRFSKGSSLDVRLLASVACFFVALYFEFRDMRWLLYRYRAMYSAYDNSQPKRVHLKSRESAKAACERHHATGRWE